MSSIGALLGPHSSYLVTLINQYSGGFPYAHFRDNRGYIVFSNYSFQINHSGIFFGKYVYYTHDRCMSGL